MCDRSIEILSRHKGLIGLTIGLIIVKKFRISPIHPPLLGILILSIAKAEAQENFNRKGKSSEIYILYPESKLVDIARPKIHIVSKALSGAKLNYSELEKIAYTIVIASRKLKHYFQAHCIKVLSAQPLEALF